jgi:hypothetical protein
MAQWYYSIEGVQHGPVEDEEIRAMLASGLVRGETLVWRDGMEGWRPISRVQEWTAQIASPVEAVASGQALPPSNGLAIASMVCGLISLPMMVGCWLGIFAAVPAVICGHMALSQIARQPFQGGRGFAITGLVTGYLTILATVAFVALVGVMIAQDIR